MPPSWSTCACLQIVASKAIKLAKYLLNRPAPPIYFDIQTKFSESAIRLLFTFASFANSMPPLNFHYFWQRDATSTVGQEYSMSGHCSLKTQENGSVNWWTTALFHSPTAVKCAISFDIVNISASHSAQFWTDSVSVLLCVCCSALKRTAFCSHRLVF